MKRFIKGCVATMMLGASPALAGPSSGIVAPAVTASITIEEDGRIIAAPMLTMALGQHASITTDREGGYSLRTVVRPTDIPGEVTIDMVLERGTGSSAAIVSAPRIRTRLGQSASIAIAASDEQSARRLTILVMPNQAILRPVGIALTR